MSFAFFFERMPGGTPTIRGEQMATYLGAKVNPPSLDPADVAVFVKTRPTVLLRERRIAGTARRYCLDIVDGVQLLSTLRRWRGYLTAITTSRPAARIVAEQCPGVPVMCIPQHHANYAREQRPRRPVTTVGTIGMDDGGPFLEPLIRRITEQGWHFVRCASPRTRAAVVAFYRQIDVQVMWRGHLGEPLRSFKNALRLANAGSFGIPTVAMPEPAIEDEFAGAYVPASSVDEVVAGLERLRDPATYVVLATAAQVRAEAYHIDQIAAQYRVLDAA